MDVRVVVPGVTDLPIVRRAARAQYAAWSRRGLRLFEYQGAVLHAKYGLVDDEWCTLGSFNVIGTAASLTVETNLEVCAPAFVATLARRFEEDLRRSRPVDLRLLAQRGLLARGLDLGARLLLGGANRLLPAVGL